MGHRYFGLACTFCLWSCTALLRTECRGKSAMGTKERDGYKDDSISTIQ
jgi:hypothetical protein